MWAEPACGVEAAARLAPGSRAAFIDKDGTLVEDVPHNVDPALLRFTPHAVEGLQLLADAGYLIAIVTNQPGIALGLFDAAALDALADALRERLAQEGITLSGFYACPHAPAALSRLDGSGKASGDSTGAAGCRCRKPAPGLLLKAASELGAAPERSWMIGDILNDIEAGRRAGCRTVLLDVGNETEWRMSALRTPHRRASNLLEAARAVLACNDA